MKSSDPVTGLSSAISSTRDDDHCQLKSLRYEDAAEAPLPVTSRTPSPPTSTEPMTTAASTTHSDPLESSVNNSTHTSLSNGLIGTPNISLLSQDNLKRDSGIAPSISTSGRKSYAESQLSSVTSGGVAREPTLPTIVVDHDEIGEFLDWEDLRSDKIEFSKRGSLMFGGKRMNPAKSSRREDEEGPEIIAEQENEESIVPAVETGKDRAGTQTVQTSVAGPREPNARVIPATILEGRALSEEETSFSIKVRSMYEHGDERDSVYSQYQDANNRTRNTITPDSATTDSRSLLNEQHRPIVGLHSHDERSHSSLCRDATELAGGFEDWEDVDGSEVDRYGFIRPRRILSPVPDDDHEDDKPDGVHRVATSLRVEADHTRRDRRPRRAISNARSSRSLPHTSDAESKMGRRPNSLRSYRSTLTSRTSSRVFQSRDRRTLAEAGDMLTLPPGLADIAEREDAGQTASALKRREWLREEKWQKMARPVRPDSNVKGGGMTFDFDTTDPRLINRTWKGIPDRWRATAWHGFLTASARRRSHHHHPHLPFRSDSDLIHDFHHHQTLPSADDMQIDVDVPRTIHMHILFRRRYRGGQRLLFRVLHAISLHFPQTGYVQGMASLVATLLCYYDEERAFVMLVRLWQLRGLEVLFRDGFEGLMTALREFETTWLGGGDVARHLEALGVASTAYGTRWYLTLFNMSIPFPAQLRVWDVFMLLGDAPSSSTSDGSGGDGGEFGGASLDVLHATAAALVDATREIVLDSDFENAMKVLTSFIPIRDEDLLMRVARTEWKLKTRK